MTSNENMKHWKRSVSHKTISSVFNYEKFEKDGDTLLKHVFPKYLRKRNPNYSEHHITLFNNYYMSKIKQGEFARQMKLNEWLLCEHQNPRFTKIHEDLFEAFFGALETVSDSIAEGLGTIYAYNFIVAIFKDIELDPKEARDPKTVLQQRGTALGLDIVKSDKDGGVKIDSSSRENDKILYTVYFANGINVASILEQESIIIRPKIVENVGIKGSPIYLSQVLVDVDDEVWKRTAWSEALKHCENFGYTEENVEIIKLRKLLEKHKEYREKLTVKYNGDGFSLIKFNHLKTSKKESEPKIAILIGIKENDNFEYKLGIDSHVSIDTAERHAIEKYLKSTKYKE